jgi:hypothetical protein
MAMAGGDDLGGRRLGQYVLGDLLGSGSFGRVYRARHQHLEIVRAVKVMHGHLAAIPEFRARFLQEARTAAGLAHPRIVVVHDFGVEDGVQYLVMDHVDGAPLLDPAGPRPALLDPTTRGRIGDVASALDHAHGLGVVHRDLKPTNVLVRRRDGHALLTDFGMARALSAPNLTQTVLVVGTYAYMSPEQCEGDVASLTTRSDVYSLAAMLYEIATGEPPFGRGVSAVAGHLERPPPSVRASGRPLPEELDGVFVRGLAKAPGDRYPTAGELAGAFAAVLDRAAAADGTVVDMRPVAAPLPSPVPPEPQAAPTGGQWNWDGWRWVWLPRPAPPRYGPPDSRATLSLVAVGGVVGAMGLDLIGEALDAVAASRPGGSWLDAVAQAVLPFAALCFVVGLVGAAIAVPMWMHRCHRNLPALGATGLTWSPAWAAGGWFVPGANLVVPYLVARELETFAGGRRSRPTILLPLWWAAWVAASVGLLAANLAAGAGRVAGDLAMAADDVLFVVAGALLLVIVWDVTDRQRAAAVGSAST